MTEAVSDPEVTSANDIQAKALEQTMEIPSLSGKSLVEAGVHFGHSASQWDPRMKHMIFGKRNKIHIINIRETLRGAVQARHFLKQIASAGLDVLLVGTKKQAAEAVRSEAERLGLPYVSTRWLGGTLTNHATIRSRLKRLEEIENMKATGAFQKISKKEQSRTEREHEKILFNLEGLRKLEKLPAALLIIDGKYEKNAIAEARKLKIPVVGLIDSDSNPELIDIVIPGNDDSLRGIHIILRYIADGILEGKKLHEAGRGLKDKSGLQVSTYEELGPTSRDKRRQKPGRKTRSRPSGGKAKKEEVSKAAEEAVSQAESQDKKPRAAVRVKPPVQKKSSSAQAPQAKSAPAKSENKPAEAAAKTEDKQEATGDKKE